MPLMFQKKQWCHWHGNYPMNSGTRQLSRFNQKPRIAIIRSSMCRRCLTTISCRVDACTTGSKQKQIASLVAEQIERANPTASSTALGSEGKPTWQWQRITHLDCFKLILQSFSQKLTQGPDCGQRVTSMITMVSLTHSARPQHWFL